MGNQKSDSVMVYCFPMGKAGTAEFSLGEGGKLVYLRIPGDGVMTISWEV